MLNALRPLEELTKRTITTKDRMVIGHAASGSQDPTMAALAVLAEQAARQWYIETQMIQYLEVSSSTYDHWSDTACAKLRLPTWQRVEPTSALRANQQMAAVGRLQPP